MPGSVDAYRGQNLDAQPLQLSIADVYRGPPDPEILGDVDAAVQAVRDFARLADTADV